MKLNALPLLLLLGLSPMAAQAQVHVGIEIGLPVAPRLEVVSPGISVVAGFPEEVFFQNGWYWCRRGDGWYRARSPRARFEWCEGYRVPRALVRFPEGRYRNWHREGWDRGHERREDRREERRHDERRFEGNHRGEDRDHRR
jgi:hypothetical protein